jgi:hypothetical protein
MTDHGKRKKQNLWNHQVYFGVLFSVFRYLYILSKLKALCKARTALSVDS